MKKDFIVRRSITMVEGKPLVETYSEQELVRCKDCKHGFTLTDSAFVTCGCRFHDGQKHEADWFCADGERKEGR